MAHVYKRAIYILLFMTLLAVPLLLQSQKAEALSRIFSDSSNGNSTTTPMVSRAGPGVTLNAEEARFKVFVLGGGRTNITIKNSCNSAGGTLDDVGDKSIKVAVGTSSSRSCTGSGDIVYNNYNVTASNPAFGDFRYVTVRVNKTGGAGIKNFKVEVSNGYVTYDELSPSQTYGTSGNSGQDPSSAFSIWNGAKSGGESSFAFKFKPNKCNYNGTSSVYLKWQDADWGEPNELGNNIRWELLENGNPVASQTGPGLGGNGSDNRKNVGKLNIGSSYTWRWSNVDKNNGIQIFMPFSEISQLPDACPLPGVSLNATCASATRANISGNISPPAKVWTYRIFLDPPNGSLPPANTDGSGSFSVTANGDFSASRTGSMRIYSGAAGGPVERSDVNFSIPGCGGGPPPPGGGDPTANKNCKVFEHNMSPGARYRFTVFNTRAVGHTSTPPEGAFAQDGNGWYWKNYNTAAVYQQELDSPSDGSVPKFSYAYPNPSRDWIVYIEKWQKQSGGGWKYSDGAGNNADGSENIGRSFQLDCYTAEVKSPGGNCSIVFTGSNIPGVSNGFLVGSPVTVTATMRNTGRATLESNMGGYGLSLTGTGGPHYIGASINPGGSKTISFPYTAPATIGNQSVTLYPDYYGKLPLGPACTATFKTYKKFNASVFAELTQMDDEDPRAIKYKVGGTSDVPVQLNWDRHLYKKPPLSILDGNFNSTDNFTPSSPTENRTYNGSGNPLVPGTLKAGDTVCAWAKLNGPSQGYVGPGNDVVATTSSSGQTAEDCRDIHDAPYVHSYGGDIVAGSAFAVGGICSTASYGIKTYKSSQPDRAGSGSQLAAIASGGIETFITASMRSAGIPVRPNGLAIGNGSPLGNYKGEAICSTDYYGTTMLPADSDKINTKGLSSVTLSDTNLPDDEQTLYNGNLTITGASLITTRHTIFVNGDVAITGDIKLAGFPSGNPLKAPAFGVIASGNIYIGKNVSRLDGLYVAQKKPDDSKGIIYTCADAFRAFSDSDGRTMIDNCGRQLSVNGSFVADQVKLLRTAYSLRDSTPGEHSDTPCTRPTRPAGDLNSCAAETFNLPQELYLSPLPLYEAPPSLKYQFYETLPPIL